MCVYRCMSASRVTRSEDEDICCMLAPGGIRRKAFCPVGHARSVQDNPGCLQHVRDVPSSSLFRSDLTCFAILAGNSKPDPALSFFGECDVWKRQWGIIYCPGIPVGVHQHRRSCGNGSIDPIDCSPATREISHFMLLQTSGQHWSVKSKCDGLHDRTSVDSCVLCLQRLCITALPKTFKSDRMNRLFNLSGVQLYWPGNFRQSDKLPPA